MRDAAASSISIRRNAVRNREIQRECVAFGEKDRLPERAVKKLLRAITGPLPICALNPFPIAASAHTDERCALTSDGCR
jgi:hypothetical protein